MKNITSSKTIAMVFLALLFAAAPGGADGGGNIYVAGIVFNGARQIKAGALKKLMEIKAPSKVPLAKAPILDESVLKDDISSIVKYYQSNGYFDASARFSLRMNEAGSAAEVVIDVNEGGPSIIKDIAVETHGTDTAELKKKLYGQITVKQGKRFEYEVYDTSKKQIEVYLVNNGYSSAVVSGKVRVNKKRHTVSVEFLVDEGMLRRFGEVSVRGNNSVKTKDITDELFFKPGELFSRAKLTQSQMKIFSLGLFKSVNVSPVVVDTSPVVAVDVIVAEGDKMAVKFGVGYLTEAKFTAQTEWDRYYLWGSPRTLSLTAGYSSIIEDVSIKLLQPYFFSRKNELSITGDINREDEVSYTNEKISSQLMLKRTISSKLSAFGAYNLEVNRPIDIQTSLQEVLQETVPGTLYYVSSISAGINYISVDQPSYPSHGGTYSLYVEPATFLLGSQVDYFKAVIENHLYGVIVDDLILATREKFGVIIPSRFTKDIPIFKRYFSGGSYSVRGYGYQQIGPKDSLGNPTGGQSLFEANVELRYPIIGKVKGVLFLDAGNVYATTPDIDFYEMSYGTGIGIRYVTPIGPLGLDAGFPVDHLKSILFDQLNVYISIGQSF
jgi:outer membrane protein insertion porin family/translocation and assembly module TamA